VQTVDDVARNDYKPIPQGPASDKTAPKIFTEDCLINWEKSGREVHNQIRGLSPYPGAFTKVGENMLKIYECRFEPVNQEIKPGTMETSSGKNAYVRFSVNDGWIYATEVQLQGKKRMKAEELLRGWRV
jgi:methionyl-tRNA formyltransferase